MRPSTVAAPAKVSDPPSLNNPATDAATANNELLISVSVTIDDPNLEHVYENQGTLNWDWDSDGSTPSQTVVTGDPARSGNQHPSRVPVPAPIPTLAEWALDLPALLSGLLALRTVGHRPG